MKKPYELLQEFYECGLMSIDTKVEARKMVEAVMAYEREKCAGYVERFVCSQHIADRLRDGFQHRNIA